MATVAAATEPELPEVARRRTMLAYLALGGVVVMWGMGPPISKLIHGPPPRSRRRVCRWRSR